MRNNSGMTIIELMVVIGILVFWFGERLRRKIYGGRVED